MEKVSAERVLELLKVNLKLSANEDTAHAGYTDEEEKAIREFAQTLLEDIESYENGYEDGECFHPESITANIPGTDKTITVCTHCGNKF